ncbi:hypothetical protein D046_8312B, partial [Vibrio parahaemolyticus V-223/04]
KALIFVGVVVIQHHLRQPLQILLPLGLGWLW